MQFLPAALLLMLLLIVAGLCYLDRSKSRVLHTRPSLTFIVPCYNAADSVGATIASIIEVHGNGAALIVTDDRSTDDSLQLLEQLQMKFGFTLLRNHSNRGKSVTLNAAAKLARNDILVFVDADVEVNARALTDALARLQDSRLGAVSCPYAPSNGGFIPRMQQIEYNMLACIQGAYNFFSAIALWGGFIAVRREAFEQTGGFARNAITEDMDLAYRLVELGWRVEQSFVPVRTRVPATLPAWLRQKLRWSSGGLQCCLRYPHIWLRNPLHLLFVMALCVFMSSSVVELISDVTMWEHVLAYFNELNSTLTLDASLRQTGLRYGMAISADILARLAFTLFALPFVWPLVTAEKRPLLLLLVIPFSVLYLPAFSLISIVSALAYLQRRRLLLRGGRAW